MTESVREAVINDGFAAYAGVRVSVEISLRGSIDDNSFYQVRASSNPELLGRTIYGAVLRFLSPLELLSEAAE